MTNEALTFEIEGIDCADCAKTIERGVGRLDGVTSCRVNFASAKLYVDGEIEEPAIIERVRDLGYDIAAPRPAGDPMPPVSRPENFLHYMWSSRETRLALLAAVMILPGLIIGEIMGQEALWVNVLALGALLAAGLPVARSAGRALRINHEININVLMTVAAIGAVLIGAYVEAGMVMVLFAIGEALEGYTAARARQSIRSLMEVVPNTATRLQAGRSESVSVDELVPGDHILVKPGERIPMDGDVVAGSSTVNQAPITGESRLIEKAYGDPVFASSVNGSGALEIEVTHLAADNTISRVIRLVEEAQEQRAPTQRLVDRFAAFYTPAVMVLALLVATVPPLLFGQPFLNPADGSFGWLYRGLALLVVACPCALVISTPVTVISAISNAARHGVLIKGGVYMEALAGVSAVAMDKTGTITYGQPAVEAVRAVNCSANGSAPQALVFPVGSYSAKEIACCDRDDCCSTSSVVADCAACEEVIALASAVELRSEHALGRAIVSAAQSQGIALRYQPETDVTALAGEGVRGSVNGASIFIGSHRYFDREVPHDGEHCRLAQADAERGATPVMVSVDDHYRGTIVVRDTVRASSADAIADLRAAGVEHVVMLTGDNPATAAVIADEVGVTDVRAGLLPADKLDAVAALQEQYGAIAMVGDGINDAPALAAAAVGIAIGGAQGGTGQAMESADIVLMNDDMGRLPYIYRLSRATRNTIWFNIAFSIGIKFIFVVLVIMGLGTMWMAVLADVGTAVLVTLNGMRLLRWRPRGGN
jgi:Cd2+/Zn2+-exporting ATPase